MTDAAFKGRRFNAGRRAAFLTVLAETCNIKQACLVAGIAQTTAYHARRHDPYFETQWKEALTIGYERLEAMLLAHAIAAFEPFPAHTGEEIPGRIAPDEDACPKKVQPGSGWVKDKLSSAEVQLALLLLNRHCATVEGGGKPLMRGRRRATPAETDAALTKKLDALARRLAKAGS